MGSDWKSCCCGTDALWLDGIGVGGEGVRLTFSLEFDSTCFEVRFEGVWFDCRTGAVLDFSEGVWRLGVWCVVCGLFLRGLFLRGLSLRTRFRESEDISEDSLITSDGVEFESMRAAAFPGNCEATLAGLGVAIGFKSWSFFSPADFTGDCEGTFGGATGLCSILHSKSLW